MSIEQAIDWYEDREGKVSYSMTNRLGPNSYDCSSALYDALVSGGFLPAGSMGNTETLFAMVGTVLKEISRSEVKRGDIFIAGTPGSSSGSEGHTGLFLSNKSFIHCSYYWNGIHTDSDDSYMSTRLPHHFYRIVAAGNTANVVTSNKPQMTILAVDGKWGPLVTLRLQEYYNTTRDKKVSHQYREACNEHLYAAQFDTTLIGSQLIRALQVDLKNAGYYTGAVDGLCGEATIKAMQKALGTTVDGFISETSDMVKALQRALNNNKLPW